MLKESKASHSNQFEVLTFDCYGTLIDWEAGIRKAFQNAMARTGESIKLAERAVQLYEHEERRIEKEKPNLSYRSILAKTSLAVADKIGWNLKESDASFLAGSLPSWTPFPETNPALEQLGDDRSLGILSNVDNDLISGTLKHLHKFDFVITAERVQSYKPALAHFEEANRIVGSRSWAHVAASLYHDIEPATSLRIPAFWVNRKGIRPDLKYSQRDVTEVRNLRELVSVLGR